jgi:hypothetical protein
MHRHIQRGSARRRFLQAVWIELAASSPLMVVLVNYLASCFNDKSWRIRFIFLRKTSMAPQCQYRPSFADTAHMQAQTRAVVTLSAYLSALHRASQTNGDRTRRERERASLLAQQKSEWGDGHRKPCDHIFLLAPFNVTLS